MRDEMTTTAAGSTAWLASMPFGPRICFAPEDGAGSGGGDGGSGEGDGGEAKPESLLFPGDVKEATGGDEAEGGGEKGEEKPDAPAGDGKDGEWNDYVPDPAKSAEENAKLKADHDAKNPADPSNKVPDDGKYEFVMPEGVPLDTKLAEAMGPKMKELGLTRRQAQGLADILAEHRKNEAIEGSKSWGETLTKWAEQAKADKEFGGQSFGGNVNKAIGVLDKFGTPQLREYLEVSGGANHPEVIRLLVRVGNAMSEDNPAGGGGGGSGKPAEVAHVLFPNDKPKG